MTFNSALWQNGRLDGYVTPGLAVIRGYHRETNPDRISFELLNDAVGKEPLLPVWEELKKVGD